ncbi:unnamed protein product [Caenorhabditis angaria]|uniref:Uncharacterized protein n=1 Tax=Caenorhabditis angaria TaxID=860376 RepID=A0A9P1MUS8_9PELO|nr:unnamed protein product [Caenorhabditis angaria]
MKIPIFLALFVYFLDAHKGGTPQERARIFNRVLEKLCSSYTRNLACIGPMLTPRFLYIKVNFSFYLRSFPNLEFSNFTLDVENAIEVPKSVLPFIPWTTVLPPATNTATVPVTTLSSSTSVTPTSNAPTTVPTEAPTVVATTNVPTLSPGPTENASTLSPAANASVSSKLHRKAKLSPIPGPILTDWERQQVPLVKINVYYAKGPKNGTLAAFLYLMSYRPNEGGNAMIVVDQKNLPK